jgi:DNA-binding NarL/FixJ family response regulator
MRRIFLCDDTSEYRALLRAVFAAEEDLVVVGEACSGQACIDDVPAARPDLVLLDLNMPGLHGLDALPRVRAAAPDADVVVLSTDPTPEAEDRALALGARACLRKPVRILDLPGAVRECVPALDRRANPRAA